MNRIRVEHKENRLRGEVVEIMVSAWARCEWDDGTRSTEHVEDLQSLSGKALV